MLGSKEVKLPMQIKDNQSEKRRKYRTSASCLTLLVCQLHKRDTCMTKRPGRLSMTTQLSENKGARSAACASSLEYKESLLDRSVHSIKPRCF